MHEAIIQGCIEQVTRWLLALVGVVFVLGAIVGFALWKLS